MLYLGMQREQSQLSALYASELTSRSLERDASVLRDAVYHPNILRNWLFLHSMLDQVTQLTDVVILHTTLNANLTK